MDSGWIVFTVFIFALALPGFIQFYLILKNWRD